MSPYGPDRDRTIGHRGAVSNADHAAGALAARLPLHVAGSHVPAVRVDALLRSLRRLRAAMVVAQMDQQGDDDAREPRGRDVEEDELHGDA